MNSKKKEKYPVDVLIVSIPETSGSALSGMLDVLCATGSIWQTLLRCEEIVDYFRVRIVSPDGKLFACGNNIPVNPDCAVTDDPDAAIVIVPELWLGPDDNLKGRYPELTAWLKHRYRQGSHLYSACSGAILLAETGLLDNCPATSHWGFQDLFRRQYPKVRFDPAPNLLYACLGMGVEPASYQRLMENEILVLGDLLAAPPRGMISRCISSPVTPTPVRPCA